MRPLDPLDIAYLAIGAKSALLTAKSEAYKTLAEAHGGELEIINEVVAQAAMLERVWLDVCDDFAGVWCYEVCEPLGHWCMEQLLAGAVSIDAEAYTRQLIADC
jgi:hypothetical protein